jgi:hypothetical protein
MVATVQEIDSNSPSNTHLKMDKFEKELCGNDVVKGMVDGKCKLKTLCETRCIRANALTTLKKLHFLSWLVT